MPTKGERTVRSQHTLPLALVRTGVERFLAYAPAHPELQFEVTPIGCGYAGYTPADIWPMFAIAPANCSLPPVVLSFARSSLPRTASAKPVPRLSIRNPSGA